MLDGKLVSEDSSEEGGLKVRRMNVDSNGSTKWWFWVEGEEHILREVGRLQGFGILEIPGSTFLGKVYL